MWLLLALTLFTGMFVAVENSAKQIAPEVQDVEARGQRLKYDIFVAAADSYMISNPAAIGTFTWSQLKKSISSTMNVDTVPSDWRLVVFSANKYVICTTHAGEGDMDMVLSHVSAARRPYRRSNIELVTAIDAATANQEFNRCRVNSGNGNNSDGSGNSNVNVSSGKK